MNATGHLRRIMAICLVVMMTMVSTASADSITVTADRLNMRKEANTSARAVSVIEKGDTLSFVAQEGDWLQVKKGSKTGYVMEDFVTIDRTALAADVKANTKLLDAAQTARATERVNMRALPMTDADIVKVIDGKSTVEVTGQCGAWYQVKAGGKEGYILSQYLVLTGESDNQNESVPSSPTEDESADTLYDSAKTSTVTERVNVRKTPSTKASIVKVVDSGDEIAVLGENGDWYKVRTGGKEGYIAKEYVALGFTGYDDSRSGVTNKEVNLRSAANTSCKVLKILDRGCKLAVTGETDDWYQVEFENLTGYIAKEYVDLTGTGTTDEPADDNADSDLVSYPAAKSGATTDRVNLRKEASTSAKVAKVLNKNASLSVLGEESGFYLVNYNGTTGYIAMGYVTLTAAQPETPDSDEDDSYVNVPGETMYTQVKPGVTTVTVNMRKEPEGDVLHTLDAGTAVTRIGEVGSWYKVTYAGSAGYIAKDYVGDPESVPAEKEEETTTPDTSGDGKTAYITATSVNMRKGAGTNYGVIKVLTFGQSITCYEETDGWYAIKAGDDTGYVSSKYVSTTEPESAPAEPDNQPNSGKVQMADWWKSDIQQIFARGVKATVTDVETGISWTVIRSGGSNHADVQPLTAADTANMKKAYGGTWSWNRRAIWVTVGGNTYAASMNGMPHGTGSITTNNFDGHHCIHFLNSRTHTGNRLDSAHQSAVKKAYNAAN